MSRDINTIKKDRLRYTKNKLSANMAYLGILFDVLYFVSIYGSDVGNYYYTMTIGFSVIYNLVFLLVAFLSSEGVKHYKVSYSYAIILAGILQFARIYGIPRMAHSTTMLLDGEEIIVMADKQFYYVAVCLILSGVACIVSGVINMYKASVLTKYKMENGLA